MTSACQIQPWTRFAYQMVIFRSQTSCEQHTGPESTLLPAPTSARTLHTLFFLLLLIFMMLRFTFFKVTGMSWGGGVGVRVPVESRVFPISSRPILGPTQPLIQRVPGAVCPGVKRERAHSPLSRSKVKNMWICTPFPLAPSWCGLRHRGQRLSSDISL
jgi:hypothetical protein